jgi:hypothetical protein
MAFCSEDAITLARMQKPAIHRWIKTECGRAKFTDLAARPGAMARLRLTWFVVIAALRDWRLPNQAAGSDS